MGVALANATDNLTSQPLSINSQAGNIAYLADAVFRQLPGADLLARAQMVLPTNYQLVRRREPPVAAAAAGWALSPMPAVTVADFALMHYANYPAGELTPFTVAFRLVCVSPTAQQRFAADAIATGATAIGFNLWRRVAAH